MRRADLALEEEPQSLHASAIFQKALKFSRVRGRDIDELWEACGGGDVSAHAPDARAALVLLAEDKVVQQLRTLRVPRVL